MGVRRRLDRHLRPRAKPRPRPIALRAPSRRGGGSRPGRKPRCRGAGSTGKPVWRDAERPDVALPETNDQSARDAIRQLRQVPRGQYRWRRKGLPAAAGRIFLPARLRAELEEHLPSRRTHPAPELCSRGQRRTGLSRSARDLPRVSECRPSWRCSNAIARIPF